VTIGLDFRAQIEKLPGGTWITQCLNHLITAITDGYGTQHNDDDTHGAVTADSVLTNLRGATADASGTFTECFRYTSPTAGRAIFGDGSGWTLIWSRWTSSVFARARDPNAANVTDVMTLTDTGTLTPQKLSGPNGVVALTTPAPAVGAGGTAVVGKVGGSGPTNTAQAGWIKLVVNGTTVYQPYWT